MLFLPYISTPDGEAVEVTIASMTDADAAQTLREPLWQTDWTSDYIQRSSALKYAVHTVEGELVALGMYEPRPNAMVVHIVYMEAQPQSNPTLSQGVRRYCGIGRLLIAFGIKLSIDYGFGGDVLLEAKTDKLAAHYQHDFGGVLLPTFNGSAPRFLIQGEAAKNIFFCYLK